jgi:hypothetical protein
VVGRLPEDGDCLGFNEVADCFLDDGVADLIVAQSAEELQQTEVFRLKCGFTSATTEASSIANRKQRFEQLSTEVRVDVEEVLRDVKPSKPVDEVRALRHEEISEVRQ